MASGGYAVKLPTGVRVPDSYYCPHCKLLLRSAVQTSEGDRLCEDCFKTIVKYGDNTQTDPCRLNVYQFCIHAASFYCVYVVCAGCVHVRV